MHQAKNKPIKCRRGGGGVERGGDPGGRPRSCSRGRPPGSPQRRARPSLVVARAALVCSMPDQPLAPPQRGRPQGSPPRTTPPPPLREAYPHFVGLMPLG